MWTAACQERPAVDLSRYSATRAPNLCSCPRCFIAAAQPLPSRLTGRPQRHTLRQYASTKHPSHPPPPPLPYLSRVRVRPCAPLLSSFLFSFLYFSFRSQKTCGIFAARVEVEGRVWRQDHHPDPKTGVLGGLEPGGLHHGRQPLTCVCTLLVFLAYISHDNYAPRTIVYVEHPTPRRIKPRFCCFLLLSRSRPA